MNENTNNENIDGPLLFKAYPKLRSIAWVKIADKLPTPVQKLDKLGQALDFTSVYIKRDDLSHSVYGGNKVRKFEFVLADAIKKGRKTIMTTGGIGTNHGLAQSVFCRNFNLKSAIFLIDQPLTEHVRYNLLLDKYFNSEFHYTKGMFRDILAMIFYYLFHRKCYLVMPGASTPIGTIGFVNAIFELNEQIKKGEAPEPDYIFVATGSTGTTAGLLLGSALLNLKTKICGVMVSEELFANEKAIVKLAYNTYKLLKKHDPSLPLITKKILRDRLLFFKNFFGGEYGLPTQEGKEAIDLFEEHEKIHLDLTYTGKAASAMIAFIRKKKDELKDKKIMFWNTLNSVDHHREAEQVDWHDLPKKLHKFFDGSVPLVQNYVVANPKNELA
ncbi:MAG: 1-aminocyclopropane-1-carboxylate deaminase/D-cysteine desulfhydrase [Promethearchaeota archaeon]